VVDDPPEPHPLSRPRPATLNASSNSICRRRRFLKPKQHNAAASTDPENRELELRRNAAVVAAVVTVSVVEVAAPDGVTVAGAKLHNVPEGNPEQLNETAELNPFSGVTEIVAVPLCPAFMESDSGEATTEKSVGRLMV
jgi:hypothetical protein